MSFRVCAVLALTAVWPALLHAQVPAGGEFVVSSNATSPAVAMDAAGNFIVAFESDDDGERSGVSARRYDASGAPLAPEFQVNTYTTGCQGNTYGLDLASDPAGNFVVVWQSFPCFGTSSQDGSGSGIYAQRYDASGLRRGSEFRVNTDTTGDQHQPSVAMDAAGNAVVVWSSGPARGVFGQRYDPSGRAIGEEFQVNAPATDGYTPSVASHASGSFIVVWQKATFPSALLARRFAASGLPLGTEFRVDSPGGSTPVAPSAAVDIEGGFVVSWSGSVGNPCCAVLARRFDPSGTPQGAELVVAATSASSPSSLTMDASGSFQVAWTHVPDRQNPDATYVRARRFDASGAPRGVEFDIDPAGYYKHEPAVAADASGNFVIAWRMVPGVGAQRFGGVVPAPAVVDRAASSGSDGNGVLEAGESVGVVPSWHNVNGATQTFDGRALGISGPPAAGVGYEIHDDAAAYGSVPDGSTVPCTECYEVAVTSGGTRPSTHWDAQLTERLTPDALGQTRIWPLHVGDSFADVPRTSPFYRFVETLLHRGVTAGCRSDDYCPGDPVTREQMAVFALIGRHGPGHLPSACSTPLFADVPASSPYCPFIEELARRGVVSGCGGGDYCPAQPVTREQMAVFLLRTLEPAFQPPACFPPNLFADVPEGSPFCAWIEELARRGVVAGCGGGSYCPSSPTTREQMAVFTTRTFGLSLY